MILRSRRSAFIAMSIAGMVSIALQYLLFRHVSWNPEEPYIIAKNILAGKGYSYGFFANSLHVTCFIPPGYVGVLLLLWKCGLNDVGVQLTNALLLVLSAGFVYRIARKLQQSRDVAVIAFAAIAFYPPFWALVFAPSPNALNIFLILLSCDLLLSAHQSPRIGLFVLLGLAFAAQLYIRPDVLIFIPFAAVWLWFATRKKISHWVFIKYSFTACSVALLLILPWTLRNYNVFHRLILMSANGGANLWVGNNPESDGVLHPVDSPQGAYVARENLQLDSLDDATRDDVMRTVAMNYIIANPLHAFSLFVYKSYSHWWMRPNAGEQHGGNVSRFQFAYQVLYSFVLIFSIAGLIILFSKRDYIETWLILIVFMHSTLISGIFFTQTRHRLLKDEPLMLLLGVVAIVFIINRIPRIGERLHLLFKGDTAA